MGLNSINGNKEAMCQECDGLEASSRETVWNQNVCVPGFLVKMYPIHSFFCGDYVTVDRGGNVSVTFVPVLPHMSACQNDTKNASWCQSVQKMAARYKSAADFSKPTVELDHPPYVTDSGKNVLKNSTSNLAPHSHESAGQGDNVDDNVLRTPSKTLTSPRDKWDTPCNARESYASSGLEDTELSPRLTHYMEEGIVPESPVLDVSPLPKELVGAVNVELVPKICSSKPLSEGMQTMTAGYQKEPLRYEKNDGWLYGISELAISSRHNVLDQTRAQAQELVCPSNVKMCTPTTHTSTNLLCDSFSNDCQLKSGGNTSGSIQQAPKYRRLCKYGDKIKRVSSISLGGCDDGFEGMLLKIFQTVWACYRFIIYDIVVNFISSHVSFLFSSVTSTLSFNILISLHRKQGEGQEAPEQVY
jgi:fanconi anemia group M protein